MEHIGFEVFTAVVMKGTMLARWFAEPISLTLKMEAICSSETSVITQHTTRRHIPEDLQMEHIFYPIFLPVNLAVFETIEQEL
jgi:hypothetical protein